MGVSKNNGTPKWMVKIMENPIKMDDLGGFPPIFGNTHIGISYDRGPRWAAYPLMLTLGSRHTLDALQKPTASA